MITFEHLRFPALLIPTWLVMGAIAVTVAVPSKDRPATRVEVAQSEPVACKDVLGVALQQFKSE